MAHGGASAEHCASLILQWFCCKMDLRTCYRTKRKHFYIKCRTTELWKQCMLELKKKNLILPIGTSSTWPGWITFMGSSLGQTMKDVKLLFRCLSYLHFHCLVNISKSQMRAPSWAWHWPSQDQCTTFARGPSWAKAWESTKTFWEPLR